jgi:hypothetical protein
MLRDTVSSTNIKSLTGLKPSAIARVIASIYYSNQTIANDNQVSSMSLNSLNSLNSFEEIEEIEEFKEFEEREQNSLVIGNKVKQSGKIFYML